jgi:uncharacterized protein (DUF2336 family)
MQASLSIGDIEAALQHADPQTRHKTLRAVTDLFLSSAGGLDDERIGVFDDVFNSLIGGDDCASMIELSERMAPVGNAPPRLVRRLATDERIAVAAPVLTQSPRLSETDLREIALEKGNDHLLAISERPGLTAPVTDVLIQCGNRDVARNVAKNTSARLSHAGLERLVALAEHDEVLGAGLGVRRDIPPERLHAMLAAAAARAEEKLKAVAAAQRLVLSMKQARRLGDVDILNFAEGGRYEEVVAALALTADLKYDAVESLMLAAEPGGLLLVCKAIGLSWMTTSRILALAGKHGGVPVADMTRVQNEFAGLTTATAERIMRFWRVRQSVS